MGFREVKKELEGINKTEIIKLISEMYKKIPSVKTYLDVFATGEIEGLVSKYKSEIEKYIYPRSSDMVMREAEARKIIRTVRKMKIPELTIELELHYVTCCMEIIRDFGYYDDNYYIALEKAFHSAVSEINKLGIMKKHEDQLKLISQTGNDFGLELYY